MVNYTHKVVDIGRNMYAVVCPVCMGKGIVAPGFYLTTTGSWSGTSTAPEQCRSCNGHGYLMVQEEGNSKATMNITESYGLNYRIQRH
jgi:hypothetical protein